MMPATVSPVALLVQIYSLGYMRDDPGFSVLRLPEHFTFSMLGLVVANDFALLRVLGTSWSLLIC